MKFCAQCHNMYYLKISDVDGEVSNTLIYYCRNCGYEDTTIGEESICVSDLQLKGSVKQFTHIVNEYTKYDPTLPRINTIKCPNQECHSNTNRFTGGGNGDGTSSKSSIKKSAKSLKKIVDNANKSAEEAMASAEEAEESVKAIDEQYKSVLAENTSTNDNTKVNSEVIYIRYDDINMKYLYVCVHCNTIWKTDNS